ncbi:hypothetical protein AgCh_013265 [Apium graveolens]
MVVILWEDMPYQFRASLAVARDAAIFLVIFGLLVKKSQPKISRTVRMVSEYSTAEFAPRRHIFAHIDETMAQIYHAAESNYWEMCAFEIKSSYQALRPINVNMGDSTKTLRFHWRGKEIDFKVDVDKCNMLNLVIDYEDEAKKLVVKVKVIWKPGQWHEFIDDYDDDEYYQRVRDQSNAAKQAKAAATTQSSQANSSQRPESQFQQQL